MSVKPFSGFPEQKSDISHFQIHLTQLLCRSQLPYKSVESSFTITNTKNKLTNLCKDWLLQTDFQNHFVCDRNGRKRPFQPRHRVHPQQVPRSRADARPRARHAGARVTAAAAPAIVWSSLRKSIDFKTSMMLLFDYHLTIMSFFWTIVSLLILTASRAGVRAAAVAAPATIDYHLTIISLYCLTTIWLSSLFY